MKGHGDLRCRDTGVQVLLVHLTIHILILVHSNLGERYGRIAFVAEDRKGPTQRLPLEVKGYYSARNS